MRNLDNRKRQQSSFPCFRPKRGGGARKVGLLVFVGVVAFIVGVALPVVIYRIGLPGIDAIKISARVSARFPIPG
jgi:hypothetical protein